MLLGLEISILPCEATKRLRLILLCPVLCATPGFAQKAQLESGGLPKIHLHPETKTKGAVEKVNLFPAENRRNFTELIRKSGDDKVHIYVCRKSFQEGLEISFGKGDEIAVTASRAKQEASHLMPAREPGKRTDTVMFRDDKGDPVRDWRTGK